MHLERRLPRDQRHRGVHDAHSARHRHLPGGYCSQRCGSAACPAGSVCLRDFFDGYCVRPCASDAECRASEGYDCRAPSRGTLEDATAACLPSGA
ncbi:MAG: hypothetical protein M5U28_01015 [Sandaracinaceae bacterium]|nr:hypothetical protein [Sandaracinaceae bacterium]